VDWYESAAKARAKAFLMKNFENRLSLKLAIG